RTEITSTGTLRIGITAPWQQYLSAFLFGQLVIAFDFLNRGGVNQRPCKVAPIQRVADAKPLRHVHELGRKLVKDRLSDKNAASGDAALAACLVSAQNATGDRQVHPRIIADDDGALAAHFAGHNTIEVVRG